MKSLVLFLTLFLSIAVYSQSVPEKDKLSNWFLYTGRHKVSPKIDILTTALLTTYEVLDNFNFLLLYGGAGYSLTPKINLSLGYAFLDIGERYRSSKRSHTYENRLVETISFKHQIAQLPISHRMRFEQRFFNKNHRHTNRNRVRYRLGTSFKLIKGIALDVNNEFFANFKDKVFRENRLYGGFRFKISKSSTLKLGYLRRHVRGVDLNRIHVGIHIKTNHLRRNKSHS